MIDTNSTELSKQDKLIASTSMIGGALGLLVALYVALAARLQYDVTSQYLSFEGRTLVITAGYYFRLLAIIYFVIALGAISGGLLMFNPSSIQHGRYLLLQIYTIGVIRALFAIISEDRYYALGHAFMFVLVLFGLIMLAILSRPDKYWKNTIIFGSQIILAVVLFVIVPIDIMDPVAPIFFND